MAMILENKVIFKALFILLLFAVLIYFCISELCLLLLGLHDYASDKIIFIN